MTEREELYSEQKIRLTAKTLKKVQGFVESISGKFDSLEKKELHNASVVSIIVENGEAKKIFLDGSISVMRQDKQFRYFFEIAVTRLQDDRLRHLYEILNEGQEKNFCKQCILAKKSAAQMLLNIFEGIE